MSNQQRNNIGTPSRDRRIFRSQNAHCRADVIGLVPRSVASLLLKEDSSNSSSLHPYPYSIVLSSTLSFAYDLSILVDRKNNVIYTWNHNSATLAESLSPPIDCWSFNHPTSPLLQNDLPSMNEGETDDDETSINESLFSLNGSLVTLAPYDMIPSSMKYPLNTNSNRSIIRSTSLNVENSNSSSLPLSTIKYKSNNSMISNIISLFACTPSGLCALWSDAKSSSTSSPITLQLPLQPGTLISSVLYSTQSGGFILVDNLGFSWLIVKINRPLELKGRRLFTNILNFSSLQYGYFGIISKVGNFFDTVINNNKEEQHSNEGCGIIALYSIFSVDSDNNCDYDNNTNTNTNANTPSRFAPLDSKRIKLGENKEESGGILVVYGGGRSEKGVV